MAEDWTIMILLTLDLRESVTAACTQADVYSVRCQAVMSESVLACVTGQQRDALQRPDSQRKRAERL